MCNLNKEKITKSFSLFIDCKDSGDFSNEYKKFNAHIKKLNKLELLEVVINKVGYEVGGNIFFNKDDNFNFDNAIISAIRS